MGALKRMLSSGVFELEEDAARASYPQYFHRKSKGKEKGGRYAAPKTADATVTSGSSGDENGEYMSGVEGVSSRSTLSEATTSTPRTASDDTAKATAAVLATSSQDVLSDADSLADQHLEVSSATLAPTSVAQPQLCGGKLRSHASSANKPAEASFALTGMRSLSWIR